MNQNYVRYGSIRTRPMSCDINQYTLFNSLRRNERFRSYDDDFLIPEPRFSSTRREFPAPINLDDLSENSSFSEDDELLSQNAYCSTSDMTTSDSEIGREAKMRYMDNVFQRKWMRKAPPQIPFDSKFPSLSPIYPEDSISSENDENFDQDFFHKHPVTPARPPRGLEMIQEISPVLPESEDTQTEEELPPVIKPLKLTKEWRPIQTSTMTSFHPLRLPKTNPRLNSAQSTPRTNVARRRLLQPVVDNFEEPRSLFDPYYMEMGNANKAALKPKHFGLPSQYAKNMGIKGILYLEISIVGRRLIAKVKNAAYFFDRRYSISSFVKVELKRNKKQKRSRDDRHYTDRPFYSRRTHTVPHNNQPEFNEKFEFKLSRAHLRCHDMLGINVYALRASSSSTPNMGTETELLGCMSFHLRRLFKKASLSTEKVFEDVSGEPILIGHGGYFLLDEQHGARQNLPEMKVYHRKYYDEIGSSMSSSLNSSPSKIMGEPEWRTRPLSSHQHNLYAMDQRVHPESEVLTRLAISPGKKSIRLHTESDNLRHSIRNKMAPWPSISTESKTKNGMLTTNLDFTSSSSSNSGLGVNYKRHYRFTLPSITTSDTTGSEISTERNGVADMMLDYNYLYADPMAAGPSSPKHGSGSDDKMGKTENGEREKTVRPVRRVQSFATERDQKGRESRRKFTFGPIGRTFHYLKHKVDAAISTSTLYPSRDEVIQWADEFESLLNHKYGVLLFKAFLKTELSEENLQFYFEVEEFKKMKPGKKSTIAKACQIYEEFIREQAPNEVNLDSTTKSATKAALESGAKPDTFNLAQARIEQLMAKDSYPRFLKSSLYLDLLNGEEHRASQASIASADPSGYGGESKRGSAMNETGTVTFHLDQPPQPAVIVEQ